MNICSYVNQSVAALLLASSLCLAGCSTARDMHTASNSQLETRRNEINRKIAEDDFGLSFGLTRWVSHATEKNRVVKEKEQIDAELLRRRRPANVGITRSPHVAANATASSTDKPAGTPTRGHFDTCAVRFAISHSQASAEQTRVCLQSLRPI